jgi:hypothetical protein
MWHLLQHWLGLDNGTGAWYLWWSGFEGDLTQLAILGTLINVYRHHRCKTCWRIGHHPVIGTPYKTCHKHATLKQHQHLHLSHSLNYPEQHKLFNQDD